MLACLTAHWIIRLEWAMKVFDMCSYSINNFPKDHSTECSVSFKSYLRSSKQKLKIETKQNEKTQPPPQYCSLEGNFHPHLSRLYLGYKAWRNDTELVKRTSYVSSEYKNIQRLPSFLPSFKQAELSAMSLPFELQSSVRILSLSCQRVIGFTASTNGAFFYEWTTMGRKWAEVFFLLVFCPLLGAPFPFNATYICLPLCCQLKDA